MEIIKINKNQYYDCNEVINNAPIFCKGIRNGREFIKKKNVDEKNYIFARKNKKDNIWEESDGKSIKMDKVLLKKSYVDKTKKLCDEINEESDDESDEDTIKKAPQIIHLKDSEKFQDDEGNILEIETRGERDCDGIYFKVNDIASEFEMKRLRDVIVDKKKSYKKDTHYKYFLIDNPTKSGKLQIKKELFLTYEGLLRVLFVSENNKTTKFINWATKTLFTAQMGTDEQKYKLVSKIFGTSAENVAEVFNRATVKTPCIYFFILGSVKELRNSMNINDDYDDEMIIGKFGLTKDLSRRTTEHIKDFGKIKGNSLALKYYSYIDPQYISQGETDLKKYFNDLDVFFKYEKKAELVIVSKKDMINVEKMYSEIGSRYGGHTTELIIKLKEKDHELELMKKDIDMEKLKAQNSVLELEKQIVLLNKRIDMLKLKCGEKLSKKVNIKKKLIDVSDSDSSDK